MTRRFMWAILGVALAAGSAPAQQVLINGAGATFPYPMYSKWFNEYHKKYPNIQINYQSLGSGGRHPAGYRRDGGFRGERRSHERPADQGVRRKTEIRIFCTSRR